MFSIRLVALSIVITAATACGGYSSPATSPSPTPSAPAPAPASGAMSVSIPVNAAALPGSSSYAPDALEASVGTTVTWTNTDSVVHTSTSVEEGWNSGAIAPGGQFSTVLRTPGTFSYHCTIHPGMVGSIVVR